MELSNSIYSACLTPLSRADVISWCSTALLKPRQQSKQFQANKAASHCFTIIYTVQVQDSRVQALFVCWENSVELTAIQTSVLNWKYQG